MKIITLKNANLFCHTKFLYIMRMFAVLNAEGNNIIPITSATIQIAAEEGRLRQEFSEAVDSSDSLDVKSNSSSQPPINYPVGKPLEVNSFYYKLYNILKTFSIIIKLFRRITCRHCRFF